jgi:hypothetical protein
VLALSAAKREVPFYPGPRTQRTLAVLVIGVILGTRFFLAAVTDLFQSGTAGLCLPSQLWLLSPTMLLSPTIW